MNMNEELKQKIAIATQNDPSLGWEIVPAGAGWACDWLIRDRDTGLCSPCPDGTFYDYYYIYMC